MMEMAPEGITRELARHRAERISRIRYHLEMELVAGNPRIIGRVRIDFNLKTVDSPLTLDFRDLGPDGQVIGGEISDPEVNGRRIDDVRQINGHILIGADHLRAGENSLQLGFTTRSAAAGRPLIRYTERTGGGEGDEYLYTLFVPMDASLAFPCFDQPDLKGRFTLAVRAPASWTVIGNSELRETTPDGERIFAETEPISTYVFSLAAGPFARLEAKLGNLPLRLFCRRTRLERAQEEWPAVLRLTSRGIEQLTGFFGHKFPFTKYDQVLLPGFAYGGMEHAGSTFLREDAILFRTTPTRGDLLSRASLLLHELTHQWFGDLVTMRWFDDLWLKEGFASYMAWWAMAAMGPGEALGLEPHEIWARFHLAHKPAAYAIDGSPGTTPIYQEVANLRDAKSAYGAIVYQKAPSLLRSLSLLLGEQSFRDGVRLFLRRHSFGNATWSDLIGAFEQSSGRSLARWAAAWIRERGMPQIDLRQEWREGRIESVRLAQSDIHRADGTEGRLWPIHTRLLLVDDDGRMTRQEVSFESREVEITALRGRRRPKFIFANADDAGYGRFLLDPRSRGAVMAEIGTISDDFLRTLLWGSLWEGVREVEIAPADYLSLVLKSMARERNEELLQNLLERAARTCQKYLTPAQQAEWTVRLEAQCAAGMSDGPTRGIRIICFRTFRAIASTESARNLLREILVGRRSLPEVEISPLDRWRMLTSLLAHDDPDARRLLAEEATRDRSDDAPKQAYIAGAAAPDPEVKKRYFEDYLRTDRVPEDFIEGSLAGFNSWNQSRLTLSFLRPALEALPQIKRQRRIFFVLAWLNAFIGGQHEAEALKIVQDFLAGTPLDSDLTLKVREVADELIRTTRIRHARH